MLVRDTAFRGIGTNRPATAALAWVGEKVTPALAALLPPTATMTWAVAAWALLAQIAVAANFPIQSGALADWRVWLLIAGGLQLVSTKFAHQESSNDPRR